MKGFFVTLLVVCSVLAAAWFLWDPYVKPALDRFGGGPTLTDNDRVISSPAPPPGNAGKAAVATPKGPEKPAAPASPATNAQTSPVAPSPATKPPAPAPKSEIDRLVEERYPMPEVLPLLTIVDGWRNVPPNAFPPEVIASEPIPFQLVIDGRAVGSSNVAPGTPLKPVRLEGAQLHVASLSNPGMTTPIDVSKTDFKQRIEARYNQFVQAKQTEIETKRSRAKQILQADPSRLAALTGKAAPGTSVDDGGDPRIAPVKESLRKGDVASVRLDEARSFHWNGSEKIGGEHAGTYDTVTVHFEVATIFGRFPTEFKCLLRGGRVIVWIDPVTEDRVSS